MESTGGEVDGAGASIQSGGKVVAVSEGSMSFRDALLDNAAGEGMIDLEAKSGGDVSLVRAELRSSGSAETDVRSDEYEVDVTDAIIDDENQFLEVDPADAVTGEPESGGAGEE